MWEFLRLIWVEREKKMTRRETMTKAYFRLLKMKKTFIFYLFWHFHHHSTRIYFHRQVTTKSEKRLDFHEKLLFVVRRNEMKKILLKFSLWYDLTKWKHQLRSLTDFSFLFYYLKFLHQLSLSLWKSSLIRVREKNQEKDT